MFLLAAYAAVDVLTENYLQKAMPDIKTKSARPKIYYHGVDVKSIKVPFKLKDGTECSGILLVENVPGTDSPKIVKKNFHCTNYFILNARRPDFRDSMEIGKDYQREYNERIPGMPPTPGIP